MLADNSLSADFRFHNHRQRVSELEFLWSGALTTPLASSKGPSMGQAMACIGFTTQLAESILTSFLLSENQNYHSRKEGDSARCSPHRKLPPWQALHLLSIGLEMIQFLETDVSRLCYGDGQLSAGSEFQLFKRFVTPSTLGHLKAQVLVQWVFCFDLILQEEYDEVLTRNTDRINYDEAAPHIYRSIEAFVGIVVQDAMRHLQQRIQCRHDQVFVAASALLEAHCLKSLKDSSRLLKNSRTGSLPRGFESSKLGRRSEALSFEHDLKDETISVVELESKLVQRTQMLQLAVCCPMIHKALTELVSIGDLQLKLHLRQLSHRCDLSLKDVLQGGSSGNSTLQSTLRSLRQARSTTEEPLWKKTCTGDILALERYLSRIVDASANSENATLQQGSSSTSPSSPPRGSTNNLVSTLFDDFNMKQEECRSQKKRSSSLFGSLVWYENLCSRSRSDLKSLSLMLDHFYKVADELGDMYFPPHPTGLAVGSNSSTTPASSKLLHWFRSFGLDDHLSEFKQQREQLLREFGNGRAKNSGPTPTCIHWRLIGSPTHQRPPPSNHLPAPPLEQLAAKLHNTRLRARTVLNTSKDSAARLDPAANKHNLKTLMEAASEDQGRKISESEKVRPQSLWTTGLDLPPPKAIQQELLMQLSQEEAEAELRQEELKILGTMTKEEQRCYRLAKKRRTRTQSPRESASLPTATSLAPSPPQRRQGRGTARFRSSALFIISEAELRDRLGSGDSIGRNSRGQLRTQKLQPPNSTSTALKRGCSLWDIVRQNLRIIAGDSHFSYKLEQIHEEAMRAELEEMERVVPRRPPLDDYAHLLETEDGVLSNIRVPLLRRDSRNGAVRMLQRVFRGYGVREDCGMARVNYHGNLDEELTEVSPRKSFVSRRATLLLQRTLFSSSSPDTHLVASLLAQLDDLGDIPRANSLNGMEKSSRKKMDLFDATKAASNRHRKITMLQKCVRQYLARGRRRWKTAAVKEYLKRQDACLTIQHLARMWLAKRVRRKRCEEVTFTLAVLYEEGDEAEYQHRRALEDEEASALLQLHSWFQERKERFDARRISATTYIRCNQQRTTLVNFLEEEARRLIESTWLDCWMALHAKSAEDRNYVERDW